MLTLPSEHAVGGGEEGRLGDDSDASDGSHPMQQQRIGVLLGEASGPTGSRWRVQPMHLSAAALGISRAVFEEGIPVPSSALRRAPPLKGERARCVLGDSAGLEGEVLSVEGGVAVLKAKLAAEQRPVRVLPLDALCKLP